MKRNLLAAIVAAALAGASGASQAHEFASSFDAAPQGTVECVREVERGIDPSGLAQVLEHSVRPETGAELVVRLQDGSTISVMQDALQRFTPGQRVWVLRDARGVRLEHS